MQPQQAHMLPDFGGFPPFKEPHLYLEYLYPVVSLKATNKAGPKSTLK